jgi:ribosomal protein L24
MASIKRIIKGDIVKLISGANKGTTGKVLQVLTKKNAVLVEGIGTQGHSCSYVASQGCACC